VSSAIPTRRSAPTSIWPTSKSAPGRRLSRAEEKAYSLPAKLAIPMMVCIFPVLFVVILLPAVVRLYTGHY
jgi:pilus assembly protein TadC